MRIIVNYPSEIKICTSCHKECEALFSNLSFIGNAHGVCGKCASSSLKKYIELYDKHLIRARKELESIELSNLNLKDKK